MTSPDLKHKAERAAAVYLEMRGYEIVEHNWHGANYKIDIIALKSEVIYFVSVHYGPKGDGSDTNEDLSLSRQQYLQSSYDKWLAESKWSGEYAPASVNIVGPGFTVLGFIGG